MNLLLFSNSTNPGHTFLAHAGDAIRGILGKAVARALFVPFAGVGIAWDDYAARVRDRFAELGYAIVSVHEAGDPRQAVQEAEAIVIGGGNTFHLTYWLYESGIMDGVRERVQAGVPYIGWSAGSNVACPTLRTTNDMPIIEPASFRTLGLVPFQINPHYTDFRQEGHGGETRDDRIREFVIVNPTVPVIGLREGTWLRVEGGQISLAGTSPARIFRYGQDPYEVAPGDDIQFLLG